MEEPLQTELNRWRRKALKYRSLHKQYTRAWRVLSKRIQQHKEQTQSQNHDIKRLMEALRAIIDQTQTSGIQNQQQIIRDILENELGQRLYRELGMPFLQSPEMNASPTPVTTSSSLSKKRTLSIHKGNEETKQRYTTDDGESDTDGNEISNCEEEKPAHHQWKSARCEAPRDTIGADEQHTNKETCEFDITQGSTQQPVEDSVEQEEVKTFSVGNETPATQDGHSIDSNAPVSANVIPSRHRFMVNCSQDEAEEGKSKVMESQMTTSQPCVTASNYGGISTKYQSQDYRHNTYHDTQQDHRNASHVSAACGYSASSKPRSHANDTQHVQASFERRDVRVPKEAPVPSQKSCSFYTDNEESLALMNELGNCQFETDDKIEESKDRASASVPKHRHKEVVRKKEEREALRGFDCDQCKRQFYANLGSTDLEEAAMQCSSRHRHQHTPTNTPDGYWDNLWIGSPSPE